MASEAQPIFEWHVNASAEAARELSIALQSALSAWVDDPAEAALGAVVALECASNIVRHGWVGSEDDRIVCSLVRAPSGYQFEFQYPGHDFDWRARHDLAERVVSLADGGLGLGMIASFADGIRAEHFGVWQTFCVSRLARPAADLDRVG